MGTNATWTSILPLNLLSATIFKMEDTTASGKPIVDREKVSRDCQHTSDWCS